MNKSDLIVALAEQADIGQRKSEEIVNTVFDVMSEALVRGDRIEIRGFGSFTVKEYEGYVGRNPKSGERIEVKSKRLPFFKSGKDLREQTDRTG